MKSLLSHSITLACSITCSCAFSQDTTAVDTTAADFFNQASREYIKQDKSTALRTLDEALRIHPNDPRLVKLAEELLKEEEQQQQQQQEKEEEQEKDEGQEKQEPEKEPGNDQKEQDQGEKADPEPQKDQGEERKSNQPQRKPGTIDPQDARRMLDALEREESDVQEKVREKLRPARRVPIEKDW